MSKNNVTVRVLSQHNVKACYADGYAVMPNYSMHVRAPAAERPSL